MGLGKQIRHYREKVGWTLDQLSSKSGVDVGTISALEQRDSRRSAYTRELATAFGLTVEQLSDDRTSYDINPNPHVVNQPRAIYAVETDWPLSVSRTRYNALSERDKGRIDGFVLALVEANEAAAKKTAVNG